MVKGNLMSKLSISWAPLISSMPLTLVADLFSLNIFPELCNQNMDPSSIEPTTIKEGEGLQSGVSIENELLSYSLENTKLKFPGDLLLAFGFRRPA